MLYDEFKPIVDLVLNNWTALQLAVEHGMGAPGGKETAQLMSVYVARYCIENLVKQEELAEVLEDLMDEEFETACHDDSPNEVAFLLLSLLNLLKEGRNEEVKARLEALPKCQLWLSQPILNSVPPQCHGNPDDDTTSSDSGEDDETNKLEQESFNGEPSQSKSHSPQPMEEDPDPGWTIVRSRRKK